MLNKKIVIFNNSFKKIQKFNYFRNKFSYMRQAEKRNLGAFSLWWGKKDPSPHLIISFSSPLEFFATWTLFGKNRSGYRYGNKYQIYRNFPNPKLSTEENKNLMSIWREELYILEKKKEEVEFKDFPLSFDTVRRRYNVNHMIIEEAKIWSKIMENLDSSRSQNPWCLFPHYHEKTTDLLVDPFIDLDGYTDVFREELLFLENRNSYLPYSLKHCLVYMYLRSKVPLILEGGEKDPIMDAKNIDFLSFDIKPFFPDKKELDSFLFKLRLFFMLEWERIPSERKEESFSKCLRTWFEGFKVHP